MTRRMLAGVLAGAVAVFAISAIAVAGPPNGGFERGSLKGWKKKGNSQGKWIVYQNGDGPPLRRGAPFPKPPQGKYAAIVDQGGPGARFLHRKLKLKRGHKIKLSFFVFYRNWAPRFWTPKTFKAGSVGIARGGISEDPNQQYRIDLMKPGAPLRSLKKKHIVKTLFRTKVGDPNVLAPKKRSFNLTKFAGRTLRLRFAEVDNQEVLNAGVDAVKLKQRKR